MSWLHLVPGQACDDDQVARLNAFLARTPGTEVLRPSDRDHPWELRVPEPDGHRAIFAWQLSALLDKADRHYPQDQ
ncbi:MAG TPA: hypothetical protein VKU77_07670, partial [Streptosporangiaceae bacterium]|nr:hypothetical protein [Streptosporangiaceae bacterium]